MIYTRRYPSSFLCFRCTYSQTNVCIYPPFLFYYYYTPSRVVAVLDLFIPYFFLYALCSFGITSLVQELKYKSVYSFNSLSSECSVSPFLVSSPLLFSNFLNWWRNLFYKQAYHNDLSIFSSIKDFRLWYIQCRQVAWHVSLYHEKGK